MSGSDRRGDDAPSHDQAIDLLQQLGLNEYEARSFVALARCQQATAKDVSEISTVPRTRVYDAVRTLESQGLVETQHSSPQLFRAVPIDEAVNTLQSEYVERTETLRRALHRLEPVADGEEEEEVTHEVWSISGDQAITSRTRRLIDGATEEVILVIGHESVFTDQLAARLQAAIDRGVTVFVGTDDAALQAAVQDALPDVEVFVSGLDWLHQSQHQDDDTEISRLLLVDQEAILVSSFVETPGGGREYEHAAFGRGFDNGLVAIVRRLMATGLPDQQDLGADVA